MADEIPPAILAKHPELAAVGEALEQWRGGEPVTARCLECNQVLRVEDVEATHTLVVSCPAGHTSFRAKHS